MYRTFSKRSYSHDYFSFIITQSPSIISGAEAFPLFIRTTIGIPFVKSPFLGLNSLMFSFVLPMVDKIFPSPRKISETDTASSRNHLDYFARQRLIRIIFYLYFRMRILLYLQSCVYQIKIF